MFIRRNKNRSGSLSVQIISKSTGKYSLVKTIGSGSTEYEIEVLLYQARQEIERLERGVSMFVSEQDSKIEGYLSNLNNSQVQVIGPELIFGRIYDGIGFGQIEEELFRYLVITRLYHPGSKLKTIDYLERFSGVHKSVDEIYRFMDKLNSHYKEQVENISFEHTRRVLGGQINIVFYDMTTLHFEASDEDDLRKMGFSKEGRHKQPQIYLGLLVGLEGFAIGYDIFEGNIFEGHTLIPVLQKFENRFSLKKPIVVADAGLLTEENIELLQRNNYQYIIGARIRNESKGVKNEILSKQWKDEQYFTISKNKDTHLIVSYSTNRAAKDEHNRKRGLMRLEKSLKKNRLTKSHINNKGYNKYLKFKGEFDVEIDYEKFNADKQWDGLKGYITNTKLSPQEVIKNYKHLWHIEKAFRMSKTDLQIRPVYHRLKHRIEGHICIAFAAYAVYKELERILKKEKSQLSVQRAAELTHNMYQLHVVLPETKHSRNILLRMDAQQAHLHNIIQKNY